MKHATGASAAAPATPDVEAQVWREPKGGKRELRLWLRLLSTANLISGHIRRNLRAQFDVTLPRFDLMAQLHKEPDGLRLSELSRRMMVTNGNITGLVERLVQEGLVLRQTDPEDRRAFVVRLSKQGRAAFTRFAAENERFVLALFETFDDETIDAMMDNLQKMKASVHKATRAE